MGMLRMFVKTIQFQNGERYPVLWGNDGFPHFHTTLWVTSKLRPESRAAQTIENKLNHIKYFLEWQQEKQRDLYVEFQKGQFLTDLDIEELKTYLAVNIPLKKYSKKANKKNKVISMNIAPKFIDVTPSVGSDHHYNRMTSVIEYLIFLAKVATQHINSSNINNKIEIMEKRFKKSRPKRKGKKVKDEVNSKNIPKELIQEFMEVAHYDNPKNPFSVESVRYRNHLMFHLLKKLAIRRGELLSLKITHMVLHGNKKCVWVKRTHDDKNDTRNKQPVAKTKERMLRIDDETAKLLNTYIGDYRSKVPNANKHPYLFVVHRKGETLGDPISTSTFDNTIVPTMKKVDEKFSLIHPHFFRHDWNEEFSEKVDANNELAAANIEGYTHIDSGREAKMRMHYMGHSSEKSGDIYNQRHIAKKANEVSLTEQNELKEKVEQARKGRGCHE
ncbi:site-specific integrase [Colwelliaceae bacterium 6441]